MNIEEIKFADAGIFQMVFGDDMNVGLGLRQEGNLDFLFFDHVSGSQRSSATSKAAGYKEKESKREKRRCRSAEHDEDCNGQRQTCKG